MECADSSPTQEPTSSAKEILTPPVTVLQEVSLIQQEMLPPFSLFLVYQRPLSSPLGFCLIKECRINTRSKRKREEQSVTAFRVGRILKWAVPFCFLSPDCQMPLVLQLKGGERRWGYWSSFTLHTGLLLPLFLFAWKYQSLQQRERERGREGERGDDGKRG